jgi:hypothetical protein
VEPKSLQVRIQKGQWAVVEPVDPKKETQEGIRQAVLTVLRQHRGYDSPETTVQVQEGPEEKIVAEGALPAFMRSAGEPDPPVAVPSRPDRLDTMGTPDAPEPADPLAPTVPA